MNRAREIGLLDQRDLLIVIVAAAAAALGVAIGLHPVIRSLLAVPLLLVLPGYALVSAIFPSLELPAVERLLLAIGSSIAIAILAGLALVTAGFGLTGFSWAFGLGLVAIVGAAVAWWRRARLGVSGPQFTIATMPRMGALMTIVAALAMINVLLGSQLIASSQQSPAPAALWLVPLDENPLQARLGVRAGSHPTGSGDYRVRISSAGVVLQEHSLELDDDEVWEMIVSFSPAVRSLPVVARLYEGAGEAEIRFVVINPVTDGG